MAVESDDNGACDRDRTGLDHMGSAGYHLLHGVIGSQARCSLL